MYENTECTIRIQDRIFKPFCYERGVRRECLTSPDLCNVYIDDMLDKIQGIEVIGLEYKVKGLHFADDTVIFADDISEMKKNIKWIESWCKINCMEINASKSGLLVIPFDQEVDLELTEIKYNDENIPRVNSYKYLGVTITPELSLENMARERISKGN